jgi:hypothetical protein
MPSNSTISQARFQRERRIERGAERAHAALVRDLAVLVETNAGSERVHTPDGFWLGAVIEAMNDQERRGCTIRNVRTWPESRFLTANLGQPGR